MRWTTAPDPVVMPMGRKPNEAIELSSTNSISGVQTYQVDEYEARWAGRANTVIVLLVAGCVAVPTRILVPLCLAIMFVMPYLGFERWWKWKRS